MIVPLSARARRTAAFARRRFMLSALLAALLLAGCAAGASGDARARVKGQWDVGTGMTRSR